MRGKIKTISWLGFLVMLIVAMAPVAMTTDSTPVIYVEPGLVETADCRFHHPVVGEVVGVETHTSVVGETVGVEDYTSVVGETIGEGDGTTTEFYLANTPVGEGTETIYFDGKNPHTIPPSKYTIDYTTGTIIFHKPPHKHAIIIADYEYGYLEFSLAESPVIPGSATIYVDDVAQTMDTDCAFDAWTGAITFLYLPSDGAVITADYTYYIGAFNLANPPLDYLSETIYVDDVPQTRNVDYTIVDNTGKMTFLYVPSDGAEITADYTQWTDEFSVDIMIANVTDLWSIGFTIEYTPFAKRIIATGVTPGDFLYDDRKNGLNTWFNKKIDAFRGEITIAYSRIMTFRGFPPPPNPTPPYYPPRPIGKDGSGRIATVHFKVVSAGCSAIDLVNVGLHDSDGAEISAQVVNGQYNGPYADLVMGHIGSRGITVGETQVLGHKIKSFASVPLEVRAHWNFMHEDGTRVDIYSGQSFTGLGPVDVEYLYVDGFSEIYYEWDNPPENLFGVPDGTYIEASDNALWATQYSFEDITLAGRLIGDLHLEGYTQYPNGPTDAVDIDVYCWSPVTFAWFGSLYGNANWGWSGVRWTTDTMLDVVPALGTEEGLNGLTLLVYSYHADAANPIRLDSLRVRVEFSKFTPVNPEIFTLQPNDNFELPEAVWTLKPDDASKWIATLACEYRYAWVDQEGYHATAWIIAEKVRTYSWWVTES